MATPLWADHQRTKKNGKILKDTEFKASQVVTDGGLLMGNVSGEVVCEDGHRDGGWVELKNCVPVETDDQSTTTGEIGVIDFIGKKRRFLITVEEVE